MAGTVAVLVAAVAAMAAVAGVAATRCGDVSSCLKVAALRLLDTDDATGRHLSNSLNSSDLDGLLVDRVYQLVGKVGEEVEEIEEGRGKKYKKKGGGIYLALFGAVGAMLLKLALATLALLSGKALLIAKVALLLSAVFGLKGLLAHHPEEKHSAKVVYAEPEFHGEWSRNSLAPDPAAQDLVYRGQRALPTV